MSVQQAIPISLDEIPAGLRLSSPLKSDDGGVLIPANHRIEIDRIESLRARGVKSAYLSEQDHEAAKCLLESQKLQASEHLRGQHEASENSVASKLDLDEVLKESLPDLHDQPLNKAHVAEIEAVVAGASDQIQHLSRLLQNQPLDEIGPLSEISKRVASVMVSDVEGTLSSLGRPRESLPLTHRIVDFSILGMAISIEMGHTSQQTLEVGLTALLCDLGLFLLDEQFQDPTASMPPEKLDEYQKHPIHSSEMIESLSDLPIAVRHAVLHVHEQCDGSGFPRGLSEQRIHEYAKILNVADTYMRLITGSGPNRPAIIPHDAIALMLHQGGRRLFSVDVVRAFLRVVTLFPLGSDVELSDGRKAQVVRRPREGYADPVVQLLEDGTEELIDLAQSELSILRPICVNDAEQSRFDPQSIDQKAWQPATV